MECPSKNPHILRKLSSLCRQVHFFKKIQTFNKNLFLFMRIIFLHFFLQEISMQNIIQKIYALFEWVQSLNSLNSKTDCKKREQKLSWIFSTKSKLNLFNRHTYGTVQMSTSNVISIVWLSSIWTKMARKNTHAPSATFYWVWPKLNLWHFLSVNSEVAKKNPARDKIERKRSKMSQLEHFKIATRILFSNTKILPS